MLKIKKEGSRCSWSMDETKELIEIMKEKKVMEQLDCKTRRNNNVYVLISQELAKKGFSKSSENVKLKFRTLKADFIKVKRSNSKSGAGRTTINFYDELNELLGDRPVAAAVGIDTIEVEAALEESEDPLLFDMEEHLDKCEASVNTSEVMVSDPKTSQKTPKKKGNAVQMTLLEIAADVKESQQSVLKMIKEENEQFLAEERRLHKQHVEETKQLMAEDREATKEMLLEILSSVR